MSNARPVGPTAVAVESSIDRSRRHRNVHPLVLIALLYLACSVALFHRVLNSLSTATTGWTSSDSYLFVWWLNWTPWALLHGQNPLFIGSTMSGFAGLSKYVEPALVGRREVGSGGGVRTSR